MRKTKNANLYLYTFLSLLFGFASTVDLSTMTSDAMAHQEAHAHAVMAGLGQ